MFVFSAGEKKDIGINRMVNVRLRDVKSHSDALAFKWPFYILTLFFQGVNSYSYSIGFLLCSTYTVHSLALAESKVCLTPPTCPAAEILTSSSISNQIQNLARFC